MLHLQYGKFLHIIEAMFKSVKLNDAQGDRPE